MKLRIASDFHLEFLTYKSHPSKNGRDANDYLFLDKMQDEKEQTLLLAGDITTAYTCDQMRLFFKSLSERFKEVYYIMGNHEHYKYNYNRTQQTLEAFLHEFDNIHLCERDIIELENDVVLYASTMWSDCCGREPMSIFYVGNNMMDFQIIGYGAIDNDNIETMRKFKPEDGIDIFEQTVNEIAQFNKDYHDKTKIIMTHHSPSFKSTSPRYKGSAINGGFGSDLDAFIEQSDIKLWVHGHMHNSSDYTIGNTRILANPRGYGSENINAYNPTLVIDTDDLI